jgi:hypothetical protein
MASIVTSGVVRGGLPKQSGYTYGYAALGIAAILAALAALLVPVRKISPTAPDAPTDTHPVEVPALATNLGPRGTD